MNNMFWTVYWQLLGICQPGYNILQNSPSVLHYNSFLNQTQFDLNSQYSFDVCCKYIFCVDWRTHMGQTKVKTYFLKLKTKAKKPFSRDSRVRCSRPEVFIKIAVPSKLAKSSKNICERVHFLIKFQAVGLQLYTKNELLDWYFSRILLNL